MESGGGDSNESYFKVVGLAAMRRVQWHDEISRSSMVEAISYMDDKPTRMGCKCNRSHKPKA